MFMEFHYDFVFLIDAGERNGYSDRVNIHSAKMPGSNRKNKISGFSRINVTCQVEFHEIFS
ncbi:MAG: hypothetical protein C4527_09275 [Candidatus Omnitrophota bacterium]|nr:MAG: hypothetical protein C4527_09275 [Candidatus Omnitrophota bacterium]